MKNLKSHFLYTKSQQSGVFLLVLLIISLLSVYFFVDFSSNEKLYSNNEIMVFQKEIDSLKALEKENRKPTIYPFNPNYITDYKGYILGLSKEEIDRLHAYRKQGKWVNSAKQFQEVTKVSDSTLKTISPFFKFPEWVTNPKPKITTNYVNYNQPKTYQQKIDLNIATAKQLKLVNGVGEKLSERIIKYRNKFIGGFISDVQLQDVYGLSPEVIERIKANFTVKTPRQIQTLNLNTATANQLVNIQHIDYDIAHNIIEERTLRDGFKSIEELTKVKGFPVSKIDIIKLYLFIN